jgi:beta-lactamase superfamily II metal-dependent hydrolase
MDSLQVRVFNVRFGDAILVTIPERTDGQTVRRHLLIDVGNVLGTEGGADQVFGPALDGIEAALAGDAVDLYVMTHEHLDHVQGLFFAADQLGRRLPIRHAWLTASAEPNYYDRFPDAKEKRLAAVAAYEQISRYLDADSAPNRLVRTLRHNNDVLAVGASPSSTRDCVEHLRTVADQPPAYVHRGPAPAGANPFTEARLELWAPEEDTSEYYGRFRPMALEATIGAGARAVDGLAGLHPPPGVDGGVFYDLVSSRERGYVDNLFTIDQAANNTSVVLSVEWRGWRLLFPGDAETRGWKTMHREGVLRPVHFLKVGHHGSHNGTPPLELLDKILPDPAPDARPRFAAVSTCKGCYRGVPHPDTIHLLEQRCELRSTEGLRDGEELLFEFHG